jgi:spore maturation protein CgeB
MKLVVFGLTISSSWGNGHATLWRGLTRALSQRRCTTIFFERDVPYYAGTRDQWDVPGGRLVLYRAWEEIEPHARAELGGADVGIVTSYCPDGVAASHLLQETTPGLSVFYDLDTPVTLERLGRGEALPFIGSLGLSQFDLVLSYTGGWALGELRTRLGARRVAPLYGHVDPSLHHPVPRVPRYRSNRSYLGTYASDRQCTLEELFVEPARRRADRRFLIGGAQYPQDFPWCENIFFVRHLPPSEHPAFFSSSRLTLNVTRRAMAEAGWCPSGRLFEATACGAAVVSDVWEGIEHFFAPGRELLLARSRGDVVDALDADDAELDRIAAAARERTLAEHTSSRRADQLLLLLEAAAGGRSRTQTEPMGA